MEPGDGEQEGKSHSASFEAEEEKAKFFETHLVSMVTPPYRKRRLSPSGFRLRSTYRKYPSPRDFLHALPGLGISLEVLAADDGQG